MKNRPVPGMNKEPSFAERKLPLRSETLSHPDISHLPDWQTTVDHLPNMVMVMDSDCRIIAINKAALEFMGFSLGQAIGSNYFTLMYGTSEPPEECPVNIYKKTGKEASAEFFLPDKKIYVRVSTRPIYNTENKVIALIHTIRDISNLKYSAESLKIFRDFGLALSNAQNIVETLGICLETAIKISGLDSGGIYIKDTKTGDLNLVVHRGLKPEFVKATKFYTAESPNALAVEQGEPIYASYNNIGIPLDPSLKNEGLLSVAVLPVKHRGKTIGCLNVASHTLAAIPETSHISLESIITHVRGTILRMNNEQDIKSSEERYRLIVENASEAIVIAQDKSIKFANPNALKMTGYTNKELTGQPFFVIVHPDDRQTAYERYMNMSAVPDAPPDVFILRLVTKQGAIKTVEMNAVTTLWEGKHAALNFIRDITEVKEAENKLKESEAKYRLIAESVDDVIFTRPASRQGFSFISPSVEKLLGYTQDEMLKLSITDYVAQDSYKLIMQLFRQWAARGYKIGDVLRYDSEQIRKDGSTIWVETVVRPLLDDKGILQGFTGVSRNITDRRRIGLDLLKSEERYRAMFENSPISMWENDFSQAKKYIDDLLKSGTKDIGEYFLKHPEELIKCVSKIRTSDVNKATLEIYKCIDKKTFLSNVNRIFLDESYDSLYNALVSLAEGNRSYTGKTVHRTFNNELIDLEVRQTIVPGYEDSWGKVLSTITDITQRNAMQEALERSEKRYRAMFESSPISMWEDDFSEVKNQIDNLRLRGIKDMAAYFNKHPRAVQKYSKKVKVLDVNNATLEMMKCKDKDTFLKNMDYIFIDKTSPALRDCFISFAEGNHFFETGTVHRRFDNELINCEVHLTIVPGYENTWGRVISALTDITQRNRMEDALKESENRFRNLFENANDGIAYLSTSGDIMEVNHAAADMFGGTIDELKGKHFTDLGFFTPGNMPKFVSMFRSILKGARGPYIVNLVNIKGRQMSLESSAALMKSGRKITGILIVSRDITERMKLDEERQQTARLESIGTLAGGIAHDFNNLLTGIMGNIGLAKMNEDPTGETYEMLEEAEKASLRAKNLTQQLLTFSKGGQPIKKLVSIGKILEESTEFSLRGSNVKPRFSIPGDLWTVDADEGQIVQVITNLIINAHDSMPAGGIVDVSASNVIIKKAGNFPLKPGKYVEVTVKDQGVGIKQEHLKRIFEPYFTTKQKGSGLGLTTVYAIVRKHDGHISVESTLGAGSKFHIYLPAVSSGIPVKIEFAETVNAQARGGKILVMDDNELIRELVPRMLTISGYEVDTAADGKEALEKYEKAFKAGNKFDVVIMDLTIPGGMGGKEAIKKIKKIDRNARVIASSGYANDPIMANYSKYGFSAVVAKPYSAQEMQQVLYSLLNKRK